MAAMKRMRMRQQQSGRQKETVAIRKAAQEEAVAIRKTAMELRTLNLSSSASFSCLSLKFSFSSIDIVAGSWALAVSSADAVSAVLELDFVGELLTASDCMLRHGTSVSSVCAQAAAETLSNQCAVSGVVSCSLRGGELQCQSERDIFRRCVIRNKGP